MKQFFRTLFVCAFFLNMPGGVFGAGLADKGVQKVHNYEFEEAKALFRHADIPEPVRAFYLLNSEYLRLKANGQYDTANDFLIEGIEKTKDLFEASLEKDNPQYAEMLMYYGALLGLKSQVYMAGNKYLQGYYYGLRGIQKVKAAYEMNSDLTDALLAMGTYEFYSGIMAQHYGAVGAVINADEAIQKGIDYFQQTWDLGARSRAEACHLLLLVHVYEVQDYEKALAIGEELIITFPRNLENRSLYAEALILSHHFEKADKILEEFDAYTSWLNEQGEKMWSLRKTYLQAVYAMEKGDFKKAETHFQNVVQNYCFEYQWQKNRALLKIGQMADLQGKRKKACRYYQRVVDSKETTKAALDAKKFLKNPYIQ